MGEAKFRIIDVKPEDVLSMEGVIQCIQEAKRIRALGIPELHDAEMRLWNTAGKILGAIYPELKSGDATPDKQ